MVCAFTTKSTANLVVNAQTMYQYFWHPTVHSRIAFLRHDLAPSIGKNSDKVKDTPTFLYRELEGKPHIYGAQ